ncbi:hypothetical protein L917_08146, partial [Phytophthora nicotianae]
IHAKTLSNLLSHGTTRPKVVEDGVLYALMKLLQVMMSGTTFTGERRGSISIENSPLLALADEVFSIGLRALFNLSCDHQVSPQAPVERHHGVSLSCSRVQTTRFCCG